MIITFTGMISDTGSKDQFRDKLLLLKYFSGIFQNLEESKFVFGKFWEITVHHKTGLSPGTS